MTSFPRLRAAGWSGYWIDAASALRMSDNAVIILDPVNLPVIKDALARGVKDYIGSNCTVGLMLLALDGLLKAGFDRVGDSDDLSGRIGCRCAADARADRRKWGSCMRPRVTCCPTRLPRFWKSIMRYRWQCCRISFRYAASARHWRAA